MKKMLLLLVSCVLLVGCNLGINNTPTDEFSTVHGVVVSVSENGILISQKENFTECDFLENTNDYTESETFYDLMSISNVNAKVGDVVTVKIEPEIAESYPTQAQGIGIDTIVTLEPSENCQGNLDVSQTLIDVFPNTLKHKQQYNGYAEYGHIQVFSMILEEDTVYQMVYEGEMVDGLGGSEARNFDLVYEVNHDSVVEKVNNPDPYSRYQDEQLLSSIIPNKVLLKLPLEVGNTWEEEFEFNGMTYTATTSIVQMSMSETGQEIYETETIVENIEGYFNNTYKEQRVFEKGRGMLSFSNILSKEDVGVEYPTDEETEDLYLFGYSLSYEETIE